VARQKTVIDKVYCSPGDIIPIGLNFGPLLAVTADTLYDFDGNVGDPENGGLPVKDSWFADTYANMLVGPVPRGRYTANFDVDTEGDEHHHRELIIISR